MAKKTTISFNLPDAVPPRGSLADDKKLVKMESSSSKYRHVEAVHSTLRTSCLSHNSKENPKDDDVHPTDSSNKPPSFLGFRNLIVLVVGMSFLVIELKVSWTSSDLILSVVVMNLRLVVENFMKVG